MSKRPANRFKVRILKNKVLILCEGKTEENYFNAFKEDLGLPKNFSVKVIESDKSDCKGIVLDAIKRAKKDDYKEVFILFDHDNQANRKEAFELAEKRGVRVFFSSICFEFWYLCHFKNSTKVFNSEAELEIELKKQNGFENYSKTDFKHYSILKDKLNTAKSNSKKIRGEVINNNFNVEIYNLNPYTDVDELVLYLEEQKSKN